MRLTPDMIANDMAIFDNTSRVDVEKVDPDTGEVVETAVNVLVLKRSENLDEAGNPPAGGRTCRFHLKARDIAFPVKERYRVVERGAAADGSDEAWVIEKVATATFQTRWVVETFFAPGAS